MNGSSTLHSGKDLAVSLLLFPGELIRIAPDTKILSELGVTVRTSRLTAYGDYPLPSAEEDSGECPDFPHSRTKGSVAR